MSPLTEADIDAIADRLADRIVERLHRSEPGQLIDATEAAERLGVARDYVYAHADELGAIRLGPGERARLRFDSSRLAERAAAQGRELAPTPRRRNQSPARRPANVDLLPVREVS